MNDNNLPIQINNNRNNVSIFNVNNQQDQNNCLNPFQLNNDIHQSNIINNIIHINKIK